MCVLNTRLSRSWNWVGLQILCILMSSLLVHYFVSREQLSLPLPPLTRLSIDGMLESLDQSDDPVKPDQSREVIK